MSTEIGNNFEKSVLIVAHPDDEILWFSSILKKVDAIIFCFIDYAPFPELSKGRRKVIQEYPIPRPASLDIPEAGSYNGANWNEPVVDEFGLSIVNNKKTAQRYEANYHALLEKLSPILSSYKNVYTHNPWGEYGHEDHVQVYQATKALKEKYKFNMWFTNYASNRSMNLMLKYISGYQAQYLTYPTDKKVAGEITELYKKYACWTWYGDYQWFNEECFINDSEVLVLDKEYGHIFPINFIKVLHNQTEPALSWTMLWRTAKKSVHLD